jgi:hypothetical protein
LPNKKAPPFESVSWKFSLFNVICFFISYFLFSSVAVSNSLKHYCQRSVHLGQAERFHFQIQKRRYSGGSIHPHWSGCRPTAARGRIEESSAPSQRVIIVLLDVAATR